MAGVWGVPDGMTAQKATARMGNPHPVWKLNPFTECPMTSCPGAPPLTPLSTSMLSTPLRALDDLAEMYGKDGHSSWGAWWELGTDPGSYLS